MLQSEAYCISTCTLTHALTYVLVVHQINVFLNTAHLWYGGVVHDSNVHADVHQHSDAKDDLVGPPDSPPEGPPNGPPVSRMVCVCVCGWGGNLG